MPESDDWDSAPDLSDDDAPQPVAVTPRVIAPPRPAAVPVPEPAAPPPATINGYPNPDADPAVLAARAKARELRAEKAAVGAKADALRAEIGRRKSAGRADRLTPRVARLLGDESPAAGDETELAALTDRLSLLDQAVAEADKRAAAAWSGAAAALVGPIIETEVLPAERAAAAAYLQLVKHATAAAEARAKVVELAGPDAAGPAAFPRPAWSWNDAHTGGWNGGMFAVTLTPDGLARARIACLVDLGTLAAAEADAAVPGWRS